MLCKVDGCERIADYKSACLCQKHYFRYRRNGDFEIHKKARPRIEDDRGYQFVHDPIHPLTARGQIYIAEHRKILYEAIGPGPMICEICGVGMTWKTCQVDHIDENPRNNNLGNLRPLCRRCNVWRSMPPAAERMKGVVVLSFMGERKTANEWARDVRVSVCNSTIIRRKRSGMTDEEALFGEKVTHNGRVKVDNRPRKTQFKHQRSNAVAITLDGVTKTAAEWSREPGVSVAESSIIFRIRSGWEPHRAVYQESRFAKRSGPDELIQIAQTYRAKAREIERGER